MTRTPIEFSKLVEAMEAAEAAQEAAAEAVEKLAAVAPPGARSGRQDGRKATTSLRIEPERLEALKIIALRERVRVNDLVLEGIDHVIGLRRGKAA
jgi:hypothetical protein